jgi:methyltransferase family protein
MGELTKVRIIHALSKASSYTRYLEICTPTTGNHFGEIDQEAFELAHRMMYRWHAGFHDGLPLEYCTDASTSGVLVQEARRRGLAYDVILVDAWHEYDNVLNDLTSALSLLRPGGTVVAHDCMPPDADHATPEYHPGPWCGVSYEAFLDFVLATNRLSYLTVDTDYGCGIIRRAGRYARLRAQLGRQDPSRDRAIAGWKSRERDTATSFEYFQAHRKELLNTIDADDFDAKRLPLSVSPPGRHQRELA